MCLLSSLGVGACAVHLVPSTGITRYYSCSECVSKENLSNLLSLCTVAAHLTLDRISWQAACNSVSLHCHLYFFGVCNAMKTIRTCCNRRTRPRQYNGGQRFTHCVPHGRSLNSPVLRGRFPCVGLNPSLAGGQAKPHLLRTGGCELGLVGARDSMDHD